MALKLNKNSETLESIDMILRLIWNIWKEDDSQC